MSATAAELLSVLRERLMRFELQWRRDHLPPPSRANPLPDPEAIRVARSLEECGRRLDRIGGQMRNRPAGGESDAALQAHLLFLAELTDRTDGLSDTDGLLLSLAHLEAMASER